MSIVPVASQANVTSSPVHAWSRLVASSEESRLCTSPEANVDEKEIAEYSINSNTVL